MTTHSTNDIGIRSGSSVPGDSILAHRKLLWTAQTKYLRKHFTEYQEKAKGFFTEGELRQAGKIYSELKNGWRKASVKLGGDFAKMEDAKDSGRKELSRAFDYALPNYRKLRNLQKDYSREHRKMVESVFEIPAGERAHFDWGDIVVTTNPEAQEFGAPFPEFDVHNVDFGNTITREASYVLPESGDTVADVAMYADGSVGWTAPVIGLPLFTCAGTFASCGVPFTLPRAGRLKIGAVLQNFVCRGGYSVTDCFGFSWAETTVCVGVFLDIVRADGNVLHTYTDVLKSGIVSHGVDLSYPMRDLDKSTPYTVGVVTELPFPSGESVRILVGTEALGLFQLDDMEGDFDATVWFKLKKIVLEVI